MMPKPPAQGDKVGLYLWVGHRCSDAFIISDPSTAVFALACYGSWSSAGSGNHAVVLEDKLGHRLNWSSLDQGDASGLLNELGRSEMTAGAAGIIPYRADALVEQFGLAHGVPVCAVPSSLFDLISTKSFLVDLAQITRSAAPGLRLDSNGRRFDSISERLGLPFFLKTDNTVSGNGCFYIESALDMNRVILKFGDSVSSAWRFLEGSSLNFHFWVGADGSQILLLPPSVQMIRLTGRFGRMEFVGNDFSACHDLSPDLVRRASGAALEIAQLLARRGYRGVGGVDVISTTDDAWVVDINPRFQGSSALLSMAVYSRVGITLGRLQMLSFASGGYEFLERSVLSAVGDEGLGAQVIVKNGRKPITLTGSISAGIYKIGGSLRLERPLSSSFAMADDEIAVMDAPSPGLTVSAGAPVSRVWIPANSPLLSERDPIDLVHALVSNALHAEE